MPCEGNIAVVEHMLRADDRGVGSQPLLVFLWQAKVVDMNEVLLPCAFMGLEITCISKQPEAVFHLPIDLHIGGGQRLGRGRGCHEAHENRKE